MKFRIKDIAVPVRVKMPKVLIGIRSIKIKALKAAIVVRLEKRQGLNKSSVVALIASLVLVSLLIF